jgi:hypothetical protein
MKTMALAILGLALAGCASTTDVPPKVASESDRQACEQEAQASSSVYASPDLSRPQETRDDPWTIARDWPRIEQIQRLQERDIFETCMAQRGRPQPK